MKVITIGRSSENDVVIRDPHASRHHLQIIQHDDGRYSLSDFGSTNGTFVNGQKIGGEVILNKSDIVRIGNTTIPWIMYFGGEIIYDPLPPRPSRPKKKDDQNFWEVILLSLITLGIYAIIVWTRVTNDVNEIVSPHDKRHTMHYCLMYFLLSWLTLGIYPLIWNHNFSDRVGNELRRRGIHSSFGPGAFWGWGVAGSLLFGVGRFVYFYLMLDAVNQLCADYNKE